VAELVDARDLKSLPRGQNQLVSSQSCLTEPTEPAVAPPVLSNAIGPVHEPPVRVMSGMADNLRTFCRNPKCRSALPRPAEHRRAFCARGCFDNYHRTRCRVCSEPSPNGRLHVKSCAYAHRQNPELYAYKRLQKPGTGDSAKNADGPSRNPYKMGIKTRPRSWGPTLSDDEFWLAALPERIEDSAPSLADDQAVQA
jgi:hypothetical protein